MKGQTGIPTARRARVGYPFVPGVAMVSTPDGEGGVASNVRGSWLRMSSKGVDRPDLPMGSRMMPAEDTSTGWRMVSKEIGIGSLTSVELKTDDGRLWVSWDTEPRGASSGLVILAVASIDGKYAMSKRLDLLQNGTDISICGAVTPAAAMGRGEEEAYVFGIAKCGDEGSRRYVPWTVCSNAAGCYLYVPARGPNSPWVPTGVAEPVGVHYIGTRDRPIFVGVYRILGLDPMENNVRVELYECRLDDEGKALKPTLAVEKTFNWRSDYEYSKVETRCMDGVVAISLVPPEGQQGTGTALFLYADNDLNIYTAGWLSGAGSYRKVESLRLRPGEGRSNTLDVVACYFIDERNCLYVYPSRYTMTRHGQEIGKDHIPVQQWRGFRDNAFTPAEIKSLNKSDYRGLRVSWKGDDIEAYVYHYDYTRDKETFTTSIEEVPYKYSSVEGRWEEKHPRKRFFAPDFEGSRRASGFYIGEGGTPLLSGNPPYIMEEEVDPLEWEGLGVARGDGPIV